jgi:hypothetical protein
LLSNSLLLDLHSAIAAHPSLITIWLGVDDIVQGATAAETAANLDEELARLAVTHAQMFVINYPDVTSAWYGLNLEHLPAWTRTDTAALLAYNRAMPAIATRHHATLIDMYRYTQSVFAKRSTLTPSGYPSAAMHVRMAQIIATALHQHGVLR